MGGDGGQTRLIGAIAATRAGRTVSLPGRRVHALLAMLALSARRTVPVEQLAAGIWDDDPPARVRGSVQTCVGRLRRLLGADVVPTEPAGYRLDPPRRAVDVLARADDAAGSRDSASRPAVSRSLAAETNDNVAPAPRRPGADIPLPDRRRIL